MYRLEKDERGLNALELFTRGIGRVLNKSEADLMSTSDEELEYLRRKGTYRTSPLWELGMWNVLADVLSYGAVKYIMEDGSFFHGVHENPGAAGSMITWVQMLQMSKHLKSVKGGMQLITDRMHERVTQKGVAVHLRHSLQALSAHGKLVKLRFNTGEFTARHVVLALPSRPLKAVKGLPDDITTLFGSVIEYPLLKCMFVVRNPWWDVDIPNTGVRTFPTREMHYYRHGDKGMIMVYADRPAMNFWRPFVRTVNHERAEIGGNDALPAVFARRMSILPETVLSYGFRDWLREPYGAGVHLWKQGVEPGKVSEELEAFALDRNCPRNVYICGEAFSNPQGFMEGAVRSAQRVVTKVLN